MDRRGGLCSQSPANQGRHCDAAEPRNLQGRRWPADDPLFSSDRSLTPKNRSAGVGHSLVLRLHEGQQIGIMGLVDKAAARNGYILTRDVARLVRSKKGNQRGDIIGRTEFGRQYMPLNNLLQARHGFSRASVSTTPGAMLLQRIFCRPCWVATYLVRPMIAALDEP